MKIVNVKNHGGITGAKKKDIIYCGRPSPLGNPYSHLSSSAAEFKVETREEAIDKYREWLYTQLKSGNQAVIKALEKLKQDSILGCWCKPLSCHCDIIVLAWEWWNKQKENNYA